MKRAWWVLAIFLLLAGSTAFAQEKEKQPQPQQPMPQLVVNARYVYVTTYDGPTWDPQVLPEDRRAASDVVDALLRWHKYTVVYKPRYADLIIVVQRRGSEGVLAVYEAGWGPQSPPLWRKMQDGGMDPGEVPLFYEFQREVEAAEHR